MTKEVDEMSAASAGSQPVAWMVEWTDHAEFFLHRPDAEMVAAGDMAVQPLYRQPQPTLTDAERMAVDMAILNCHQAGGVDGLRVAATLRSLLERTK